MNQIVIDMLPKAAEECPYSKYWKMTNKHECTFKQGMYCRCSLETGDECIYLIEKESEEQGHGLCKIQTSM